jgi:hypothetical protein
VLIKEQPKPGERATGTTTAARSATSTGSSTDSNNLKGKIADGLYPHISRRALGVRLGLCESAVGYYLRGHRRVPLDTALRMASLLGIRPVELARDLRMIRAQYVKRKKAEMKKERKGKGQ